MREERSWMTNLKNASSWDIVNAPRHTYNPITKKLVISRDVKFNEEEAWNWSRNDPKGKSVYVNMEVKNKFSMMMKRYTLHLILLILLHLCLHHPRFAIYVFTDKFKYSFPKNKEPKRDL